MPHILFVFIDGIGLGHDTASNPFHTLSLPAFEKLADAQRWTTSASPLSSPTHVFLPIDANLGVEGLPQSGTGQATLFTGINCAKAAGRHFGPFPHSKTKPIIAASNVFTQVQNLSLSHDTPTTFANAYPPIFFERVKRRDRWTVTTRACLDAGLRIRSSADLLAGRALPANLTGVGWPDKTNPFPPITEAEAARRLARLAEQHVFTLYEYYLTDKVGHSQDAAQATQVLQSLNRFLAALLESVDTSETLVLLTSDHGNLEDLGTKSHTRHPVPFLAYGRNADHFSQVQDLTHVVPALLSLLA